MRTPGAHLLNTAMLLHEFLTEAVIPRKPFKVTVFHGTDAAFDRFDTAFLGSAHGGAPINMTGINFTDSREVAATFGKRVLTATLDIRKPYVMDAKGRSYSVFKHILNDRLHLVDRTKYDTIIIKNYADAGKHGDDYIVSTHYIPLDPAAITLHEGLRESAEAGRDGDAYFDLSPMTMRPLTNDRSRETLVSMSPQDFLALAKAGRDPQKAAGVRRLLRKGKPFSSLPYLDFVHDGQGSARVTNHEGRHRAQALADQGVRSMPVVLVSRDGGEGPAIRWGSQHRPTDRVARLPATLHGEDGRASIPMPRSTIFPQA